jgi:hypothetical protein
MFVGWCFRQGKLHETWHIDNFSASDWRNGSGCHWPGTKSRVRAHGFIASWLALRNRVEG